MNPHHEDDYIFYHAMDCRTIRDRIGLAVAMTLLVLFMIGISAAILYAIAQAAIVLWRWIFG